LLCRAARLAALLCCACAFTPARAQEPAPEQPKTVRELFVPFSELNVVLENQPQRVLMTRKEYDELVKKAKQTPDKRAPQAALTAAAEYTVTLGQQRAQIAGRLSIEVLDTGLHALPL
jgi:hypothetical protein